jgi:hypothetical protein
MAMVNGILCFLIIGMNSIVGQTPNWHEDVFFWIHFDLHPNAMIQIWSRN